MNVRTFEIHDIPIVTWKFQVTKPKTKFRTFITYWFSVLLSSLTSTAAVSLKVIWVLNEDTWPLRRLTHQAMSTMAISGSANRRKTRKSKEITNQSVDEPVLNSIRRDWPRSNKERRTTLTQEIIADPEIASHAKRKFTTIQQHQQTTMAQFQKYKRKVTKKGKRGF